MRKEELLYFYVILCFFMLFKLLICFSKGQYFAQKTKKKETKKNIVKEKDKEKGNKKRTFQCCLILQK